MRTLIAEKCTADYDCYYDSLTFGYMMVPKHKSYVEEISRNFCEKKKVMSPRNPVHTIVRKIEGEEWKPVVWGGGIYANEFEVSNLGRVRSVATKEIITTYYAETRKGNQVHLGDATTPNVAHLVAESFVPNDCGGKFICHLDGDYQNDRWDNLEWRVAM